MVVATDGASVHLQTGLITRANGSRIKCMVRGSMYDQMVQLTRATGQTTFKMDSVGFAFRMVMYSKETSEMAKWMDTVSWTG